MLFDNKLVISATTIDKILEFTKENNIQLEYEKRIVLRDIDRCYTFEQLEEFEEELCRINRELKKNNGIIERYKQRRALVECN